MGLSFGKNKSKNRQEESTTQTYTPNAGFVNGVTGLLDQAKGLQYAPTTQDQINGFANPYIDQVASGISTDLRHSRDVTGNDLDAQAARAGAFGGSGWGLLKSGNIDSYARQEASALTGLRASAYDRALSAAQTENQAQNQFGLAQLAAQLQGYGLLNYGTTTGTGLTKSSGSGYNFGGTYGR